MTTSVHDYRFLLSERGTLERMLREIPPEHVIDRMSLEGRKEEVDERIAAFEAAPTRLVETQIAFRGGPVSDDGGIEPGFAADALGAFTDAIATVGVSQSKELDPRGRLPNRSAYEMVVRDTFPGSFGFHLEREFPTDAPPEEPAALEGAIERLKSILAAADASSDAADEAMAKTDDRAIRSVHKFLETMAKRKAYCALRFKGDDFRFENADDVRRGASRVNPRRVHEVDKEMVVRFLGALPDSRKVEFVIEGADRIEVGKVAGSVKDVSEINRFLDAPARVMARARQAGKSKPTYTITGWEPAR